MAKPVVDGLHSKLGARIRIARIDIGDDAGATVAQQYGIRGVPAYVLIDPAGKVLYRKHGGTPDAVAIEAATAAGARR